MMKILFIIQCSDLGGMEQVTRRFSSQLLRAGCKVSWVSLRPLGKIVPFLTRESIDVSSINLASSLSVFPWLRLVRFILRQRFDRVVVVGHSLPVLILLLPLKLLGRFPRLYHHIHFHSTGVKPRCFWQFYFVLSYVLFDRLFFPSSFSLNDAYKALPCYFSSKAFVVKNPIVNRFSGDEFTVINSHDKDRNVFFPMSKDASKVVNRIPYKLGCAGWLIPRKRFAFVLQTLSILKMYGVEYECYFAGDGPLREDLEAYSISLGLDSMVHFCGWVHDMFSFYRSLDVFLFASSADALGLVPLEAITSGTPAICSVENSGLPEYIPSEWHDLVIGRSNDKLDFAQRIMRVLDDESLACKLVQSVSASLYDDSSGSSFPTLIEV